MIGCCKQCRKVVSEGRRGRSAGLWAARTVSNRKRREESNTMQNGEGSGYLSLLKTRPFALFFAGQVGSNLGDGLHLTAVTFFALRLGASPFELGVVAFCGIFPRILFGPLGGALADRWDRRATMIVMDLIRCVLVLAIPTLYFVDLISIWVLASLAFLLTSCSAFFLPASKAYIPEMIGKGRVNLANGLLQTTIWPAHFLGAGLIGPLQLVMDLPQVFFINAASYALSATTLSAIRLGPARKPEPEISNPSLLSNLLDGYQALKAEKALHIIVMTYAAYIFFWRGLLQVGLPLYVARELGGGAGLFGIFMAVNGAGEMVSSLLVGKMHLKRPLAVAFLGETLFGLAMLGVVASGHALPGPSGAAWLVGAFIFVGGLALPITDVPTLSAIQKRMPEGHVAKVFSYWNTMGAVGSALGTLLLGALFNLVPVIYGFLAGGAALILLGAAGASWMRSSEACAEGKLER